jgi:hypothetical protein
MSEIKTALKTALDITQRLTALLEAERAASTPTGVEKAKDDVAALKRDLDAARGALEQLAQERMALVERNAAAERALSAANDRATALESARETAGAVLMCERDVMRAQLDAQNHELEAARRRRDLAVEALAREEVAHGTTKRELTAVAERLKARGEDLQRVTAQRDALEQQIKTANARQVPADFSA